MIGVRQFYRLVHTVEEDLFRFRKNSQKAVAEARVVLKLDIDLERLDVTHRIFDKEVAHIVEDLGLPYRRKAPPKLVVHLGHLEGHEAMNGLVAQLLGRVTKLLQDFFVNKEYLAK